jgi:hypothetical protein
MISSTFFFLFSQLSVGMLLTLLVISPRVVGGTFFEFASKTAAILMGVTLGFDFLFPSMVRESSLPFGLLGVSAVLAGVYNRTIHIGRYRPAYFVLVASTLAGLGAIAADSLAFTRLMELGGWERWLLLVNHFAATALLGSGMLAMVFGHWYLVVPNLSIEPLMVLTKFYLGSVLARIATIGVSIAALVVVNAIPIGNVASELLVEQGIFFWPRVIFGVVIPIVLGVMTWSTVRIRHTQAATGLLYLVVVTLLFGEFFSKFLLFSISVPI